MDYDVQAVWNAVVSCDAAFDGRVYYAVKTVGVYCRPSCKSRTPLRKNVRFFYSPAEAEGAGFRPCKRCRPDLSDYAPDAALARQARGLIDAHFYERALLAARLRGLCVSPGRLAAVFKQTYGVSPGQYGDGVRLARAQAMLTGTDAPILEVSAAVGFDSLAAFYRFFKRHTGITPKQHRAGIGMEQERSCAAR